jgi:hypothetical protein
MLTTIDCTLPRSLRHLTWCFALAATCLLVGCSSQDDSKKKDSPGAADAAKAPAASGTKTPAADKKSSPTASPTSGDAAGWGTLKGRFVFDGEAPKPVAIVVGGGPAAAACCAGGCPENDALLVGPKGGLANVVIYVRTAKGKKLAIHPDYEKLADEKAELDNIGCMFKPHVSVVRTGQTLVVKNSDAFGHNTNIQPIKSGNAAKNFLLAPKATEDYKFKVAETLPTPIACNIHPWMKSYVLARDDPYATVTAADGTFEIKNLPAGSELEFQLWHEKAGYLSDVDVAGQNAKRGRVKIKIKPGDNDLGDIKVPAAKLAD